MKRLFGLETEYGIHIDGVDVARLVAESRAMVTDYTGPHVKGWDYSLERPTRDMRGFSVSRLEVSPSERELERLAPRFHSIQEEHADMVLPNGARLYNDHGHPEYSTPECTDLRSLVAHAEAGDRIVLEAARRYAARAGRGVTLYKNNTDYHGASFGCHESYLMGRQVPVQDLIDALAPFLATRQIFTGTGLPIADYSSPVWLHMSQRSPFVEDLASVHTQFRRPLINTRDEPHAPEDRFRRLHVICGDTNMSQWATAMKVGTTVLVLDLIESGWRPPYVLTHAVRAVQDICRASSPYALVECRMREDRKIAQHTALEVQRLYLEAATAAPSELPEREWVLHEWDAVLQDLEREPQKASDRADWIAKRQLVCRYAEATRESPDLHHLHALDLSYHDIDPESSLHHALVATGEMRALVNEDEVAAALSEPPRDTRAFVRGRIVRDLGPHVRALSWSRVTLEDALGRFDVDLGAMLNGDASRINRMVANCASPEQLMAALRSLGTQQNEPTSEPCKEATQ